MASDIELLAGLEGGGKLSGKSGQKIQNQLNNIIGNINKNPLKVKIDVDDTLFKSKLQKLTADAINEANKIKAAYAGIFPQNNPGNNPPPPPPPPPPTPPVDNVTNYNNELAKTESLLKQVNKAREQWSAANKKGSKTEPFYIDLAKQKDELEQLAADLKKKDPTKLTIAKARETYSDINARFRESARQIGFADFDFNDDKRFQKLREANRELASMQKNMETWTASKNGASKSQFAIYEQQAADLAAAIKDAGRGGSIDALISKLAEVRSKAQEAANVIAQMHENRRAKDDIKKGEDGYRDALDKIRKQEDELRKQLSEWNAAGQDSSKSKAEYDKLKSLIKEYKQLRQELAVGAKDASGNMSFLNDDDLSKRLKALNAQANEYRKAIAASGEDCKQLASGNEDYYKALSKVNKEIDSAEENHRSWTAAQDASDDVASKYSDIGDQVKKLKILREELEAGSLSANEFNLRLLEIQTSLAVDEGVIKNKGLAMTKAEEAEKFTKQLKEVDAALEQNEKNMREWSRAKTGAGKDSFSGLDGVQAELKDLRRELLETGRSVERFDNLMAKLNSSSSKFGGNIKDLNEDSKTLGDSVVGVFQQFGQYIDVMDVVFKGIEWSRQMIEAVTDIDTAMTELRKVTDETDATYSAFLETAATRAQNLGATVVDVVSSSADFARLGHDLGDASALADAALIYKNVGDGIKDIDTASSSIISTMQAFGIEAENAMSIVDSFNAIGNNFAISSGGVGEALLNSAASLAAAGNDIHESVALIAAANTTIQDPGRVGTALKTLSMYLRAAKTEAEDAGISTEGMADSVSQLRDELLALTGNKVDIMSDAEAGKYKSTVEILRELSMVWDDLSDTSRTNITELIGGGVRNANIISALMKNFEIVDRAITTSTESSGSALAENEKYLDSIVGKTAQFQAAFQDLSTTFFNSDMIKGFVDAGTSLLNVINSVSKNFGPILLALAGGRILDTITNLKDVFKESEKLKTLKAVFEAFGGGGKLAGGGKLTPLSNAPAISWW